MYYGWVVVGALVVISAMAVALAGPVTSFFIPAMHAELGIPLFYFGLAMSTRQLGFALVSPWLGRFIDRHGARGLLVAIALASGAVVFTLSQVQQGWHVVALIGLLGLLGLQGAGGDLYGSVVISKWFHAHRARAMAIAFIGIPLGIFVLTPLTQYCIDAYGWKTTWQLLGIGGGGTLLLAALLLKSAPAQPGDGPARPGSPIPPHQHQWTREQALRSGAFWRVAISFGVLMFTISTVAMFRVPHFIDRGVDATWVAAAFSMEAVVSALVALPVGMLADRFRMHHLTAIGFSFAIIMLVITIYADSVVSVFAATMVFGLGAASVMILQNAIWPAYFGSLHIGAIRGAAMPVTLSFAVLGAPIAGWVRDSTGSFTSIWWLTTGAMVVAMGLILMTPRPEAPGGTEGV